MPSHSKKQHNFMEAIAHSPSFAKKVHIPQSVGKDYAAADKGKTFKRGGDMKGYADGGMPMVNKGGKMVPSFAADGVGKMAKGGMASKMKMFEKSSKDIEKKGMKEGSKADKALDKKQMMGMKAGGRVRRMAAGGTGDPFELSDTDRENYAKNGAENLKRFKGFFGFGDKEEAAPIDRSRDVVSKPTSSSSAGNANSNATYTPRPPLGITKPNTQSPRTRRESDDTSFSDSVERDDAAAMDRTTKGPQYTSSINTDEGEYSYPAFKPSPARRPVTVSRTRENTSVTAAPAKGKVPAKIDSEKLLKDAEEEVLRKKPTAMTEQMRKAPTTSDLYKGQKSMGDEIDDALKSFRASIRSGNDKGFKGALSKQFDTPPFHGKERKENKGKFVIEHDEYSKGGKVKRMRYGGLPEDGMDMGQPMRGMAPTMAPRAPSPIERVPMEMPKMPKMPKMPDKEMVKTATATSAPRPEIGPRGIKAGGQVKKMAQGGFTREADGIAKKGKTQGKVVKMAKGGFVKNADGCAQRGKTKAFQVKMKNGGMC
jgi:hypothetical protein